MEDSLIELLYPQDVSSLETRRPRPEVAPHGYTTRLSTLSIPALTSTEPEALAHDAQSLLRSLSALAKRSYKSINASTQSFALVQDSLPNLSTGSEDLRSSIPSLESAASTFSTKYGKPTENPALDRRRRALRLNDSVERMSNVLELPTLLQSTISASAGATSTAAGQSSASANASYASALDLYAHIKRLQKLYPDSPLIRSIAMQSEDAMKGMTARLITTLRSQNLKLAAAMRLVGLLRRVAPELDDAPNQAAASWNSSSTEGSLGALFLVCRLANLTATLDALEPLRDLADQETKTRKQGQATAEERNAWAAGQQTERFLKRYIEVFREQCFAIVSMHKSIFPNSLPGPLAESRTDEPISIPTSPTFKRRESVNKMGPPIGGDRGQQLPSALSTFSFELVETLMGTLKAYLPNVQDKSSRESLLTQFLYCAGSLGRLGGDFGMMLAVLEEEMEDAEDDGDESSPGIEWIEVMKRHRVQAGRLELLASGVGSSKTSKPTPEVTSPA